jgi:hypothetical protein
VPAAAVIPAPIAYIKVAAVKKLVVGFLTGQVWPIGVTRMCAGSRPSSFRHFCGCVLHWMQFMGRSFTLKKLECFKQAFLL